MRPAVQWNITKVIAPTMTHPEMIIRDILNSAVLIVMEYPTSRQPERTGPREERAHRTDGSSRLDYV
jgi:hypothetical protein